MDTKYQKIYLEKLKDYIRDFIASLKKRYEIFPWKSISKIKNIKIDTPIVISDVSFTKENFLKEVLFIKKTLNKKIKLSYYNKTLRWFIKESYNKEENSIKNLYYQFREELRAGFKKTMQDLIFCLEGLKEINKKLKDIDITESCQNLEEARKFLQEVYTCAKKYDANYFIVKDGASKISNNGNPAISHARKCHKEWEKNHGFDPDEDWLKESVDLNSCNTIIFDFGSVLVKSEKKETLANEADISEKYFYDLLSTYFKSMTYDSETIKYDDMLTLYRDSLRPELKKYADRILKKLLSSNELYDYTIPLLKYLKSNGYKLYYLSNWTKLGFEACKEKGIFDILKYFDGGIVSYQVGLKKPDPNIYKLLLIKYKIDPKKAIFYDDKKENIDAAKKLGMKGVQFNQNTVAEIMRLKPITESEDLFNENYIISHPNYEFNLDKWRPGVPLFVTGTSGDGKSTLANNLADEKNGYVAPTDILLCRLSWSKEKFDHGVTGGRIATSDKKFEIGLRYVQSHPELPYDYKTIHKCYPGADYLIPYLNDYIKWILQEAQTTYRNDYIVIEGCDISLLDPEFVAKYPLIIIGCSRLKALIQRAKRESASKGQSIFKSLWKYIKKYNIQHKELDTEKETFLKNIRKIHKNNILESEDIKMQKYYEYINENGEVEDLRDFIIECLEELLDDDDDVLEEGANSDIKTALKTTKKQFKTSVKNIKKYIKNMEFDKANVQIDEINKLLDNTIDYISGYEQSGVEVSIGWILQYIVIFGYGLVALIPLVGLPISIVQEIKETVRVSRAHVDSCLKNQNATNATFNLYTNKLLGTLVSYKEILKKLKKQIKINQKISTVNNKLEAKKTVSKNKGKNRAMFEQVKQSLYSSCARGIITVEEREELLKDLRDQQYLSEQAAIFELSAENESKKEQFENIKSVLYERCNNGELSISQREELIDRAYSRIFKESKANIDPKKADKKLNTAAIGEDKNLDKSLNTAMKDTSPLE